MLRPKKRPYYQHVTPPPPKSFISGVQINLLSVYFICLPSNQLTCPQHSNHISPPTEINKVLIPELSKIFNRQKKKPPVLTTYNITILTFRVMQ